MYIFACVYKHLLYHLCAHKTVAIPIIIMQCNNDNSIRTYSIFSIKLNIPRKCQQTCFTHKHTHEREAAYSRTKRKENEPQIQQILNFRFNSLGGSGCFDALACYFGIQDHEHECKSMLMGLVYRKRSTWFKWNQTSVFLYYTIAMWRLLNVYMCNWIPACNVCVCIYWNRNGVWWPREIKVARR